MIVKVAFALREIIPLCLTIYFVGPVASVRSWAPITTRKLPKTVAYFITPKWKVDIFRSLACHHSVYGVGVGLVVWCVCHGSQQHQLRVVKTA